MLGIVDLETGTILRSVDDGDKVKVIPQYVEEYYHETDSIPFTAFVKLNCEEMDYLVKELKHSDIVFIISLLPYLSYMDNCIKDRRGNPLSVAEIAEKIGDDRSNVNKRINHLIDLDILCRAKNSKEFQLFMNPWIAGKGNRCNRVLASMFRNYPIRSKGGITWQRLARQK